MSWWIFEIPLPWTNLIFLTLRGLLIRPYFDDNVPDYPKTRWYPQNQFAYIIEHNLLKCIVITNEQTDYVRITSTGNFSIWVFWKIVPFVSKILKSEMRCRSVPAMFPCALRDFSLNFVSPLLWLKMDVVTHFLKKEKRKSKYFSCCMTKEKRMIRTNRFSVKMKTALKFSGKRKDLFFSPVWNVILSISPSFWWNKYTTFRSFYN